MSTQAADEVGLAGRGQGRREGFEQTKRTSRTLGAKDGARIDKEAAKAVNLLHVATYPEVSPLLGACAATRRCTVRVHRPGEAPRGPLTAL